MKIFVLLLLFFLNSTGSFLFGWSQAWTRMGTTTVKFSAQKDAIYSTSPVRYERIKFSVSGAPISLEDATVVYSDGTNEVIHILSVIYKGGESRELPLKNDSTDIARINITYKAAKGFGDQNAKVSVWGISKTF